MELLKETVESHPEIANVYFTEDGHHHFRAHEVKGELIINGQPIVKTMTREEVLAYVAPIASETPKKKNDK